MRYLSPIVICEPRSQNDSQKRTAWPFVALFQASKLLVSFIMWIKLIKGKWKDGVIVPSALLILRRSFSAAKGEHLMFGQDYKRVARELSRAAARLGALLLIAFVLHW